MTVNAANGPSVNIGQQPPTIPGGPVPDYNPDRAPSPADLGYGLLDPRFGWKNGGGGGSPLGYFFDGGPQIVTVDQVPATAAVANIAVGAHPANGVPATLVNATGAGVIKMAAALTIPPTGLIVPACLALDSLPAFVPFGQNSTLAGFDPTKALARAVSITGVAGGSGGNFLVAGYDEYGYPQTELIAAAAGAATTNGVKTWKFIQSVTPQFADAHNYSVGTADIFGLGLRVDRFAYARIAWNDGIITANTGFVAADLTTPATDVTGAPRGSYATQSASDGAKRLQIFVTPSIAQKASMAVNNYVGLFGVTPA